MLETEILIAQIHSSQGKWGIELDVSVALGEEEGEEVALVEGVEMEAVEHLYCKKQDDTPTIMMHTYVLMYGVNQGSLKGRALEM